MAKHAPKEPGVTLGASSVLPCWHSPGKPLTAVSQLSPGKKKNKQNNKNWTRNFYWESLSRDQSLDTWSLLPQLAVPHPLPCAEPRDCTRGHQKH